MAVPKQGQGVVIGKNVRLGPGIVIWNYVVIGDNTTIAADTVIGSFCDIGKNVVIGKACNIQTHVTISNGCVLGEGIFVGPNSSLLNDKYPKSDVLTPVKIRDNATIGGGVLILPNVTIGEGALVAAGSLVTRDVPPSSVVMGSPARIVMPLEEYAKKQAAFNSVHRKVKE